MRFSYIAAVSSIVLVAGCGSVGQPRGAPTNAIGERSSFPQSASHHLSGSALAVSWGDVAGFSETACELIPPQAVDMYVGTPVPSDPDAGENPILGGITYSTATDSYGNAGCRLIWYTNETNQAEIEVDFVHEDQDDSAAQWLTNEGDTPEPADGVSGEYVAIGTSGGQPYNESVAPYSGGLMDVGCTGLTASICTSFLQVAIARAPQYAPTDTLYGAGQP